MQLVSRLIRAVGGCLVVSVLAATPAWAPDSSARLDIAAAFDRRSVFAGQVTVIEVGLQNRGPNRATGVVIETQVTGGRILRARAQPGWCAPPRAGHVVRCAFRTLGFGSGPHVTLHVLPQRGVAAVRAEARVAARRTRDPVAAADRSRAAVRVARRAVLTSYAELSFVLQTPSVAVAGRPFRALLRVLNRGPAPARVVPLSVTPVPDARVELSRLPGRLARGQEEAVTVDVTARRPGSLALRVRVGRGGNAIATLQVRR